MLSKRIARTALLFINNALQPPNTPKYLTFKAVYNFASIEQNRKISDLAYKYALLSRDLRCCFDIPQIISYIQKNFQLISSIGKTTVLDFLNQYYMDKKYQNYMDYVKLVNLVFRLHKHNLNMYEKTIMLGILHKTRIYFARSNRLVQFQAAMEKCVDSIIYTIQTEKNLKFFDYLNIFFVFRVQTNQNLILKCMQKIDSMILKQKFDEYYPKAIFLLFNQLKYHPWSHIRKFKNIVHYLSTKQFLKKKQMYSMQDFCQIFYILCSFKLHLVGQRKISPNIKLAIQILKPKLNSFSIRQLFQLAEACAKLPARYFKQFKNDIMKLIRNKIYIEKADHSYKVELLSIQDYNKLFQDQAKSFSLLFFNIVFFTTPERYEKSIRGVVIKYFRNYINTTAQNLNKLKITQKSQYISRICLIALYFLKHNQPQTVSNAKKIIEHSFNAIGYRQSILTLNFVNFLTLFELFQKDLIISDLKSFFHQTLHKRKSKISLFDNKVFANSFQAVRFHINSESTIVKQALKVLIREIFEATKSQKNRTELQIGTLFQILRSKSFQKDQQMKEIQKSLIKRFKDEQIQLLFEYFITNQFKQESILTKLVQEHKERNLEVENLLDFLCSLSLNIITDSHGKINKAIVQHLQNYRRPLNFGIKKLNQVKKCISLLSHFSQNFSNFLPKLYFTTLSNIQYQIAQPGFQLQHKFSRLIVDFAMKFQSLISSSQLLKNKQILQKCYRIMLVLMKIEQHQKLYLHAKFLEFVTVYDEYISVEEGIEFYSIVHLKQLLKNTENAGTVAQALLIFLKLHAFELLPLLHQQAIGYTSKIIEGIKDQEITIYKLHDFLRSLMYQTKIKNILGSNSKLIQEVLSPIVHFCLKNTDVNLQFYLMLPFINYFRYTNQLPICSQFFVRMLSIKVMPVTVEYFLKDFPIKAIDQNLMQAIVNKMNALSNFVQHNSILYLFFLQKMYFQIPQKHKQLADKYFKKTEQNLLNAIEQIKQNKDPSQLWIKESMLNRFEMYMFACIKRGKTSNNRIFNYLTSIILKDVQAFKNKFTQSELHKNINHNIAHYLQFAAPEDLKKRQKSKGKKLFKNSKQILNKQQKNTIKIINHNQYCKILEEMVAKQGVKCYKDWKVGNVVVPYCIQEKKQVIIIGNMHYSSQIQSEIKFNGTLKFQFQVLKKALPDYKFRVFDELEANFIVNTSTKSY